MLFGIHRALPREIAAKVARGYESTIPDVAPMSGRRPSEDIVLRTPYEVVVWEGSGKEECRGGWTDGADNRAPLVFLHIKTFILFGPVFLEIGVQPCQVHPTHSPPLQEQNTGLVLRPYS